MFAWYWLADLWQANEVMASDRAEEDHGRGSRRVCPASRRSLPAGSDPRTNLNLVLESRATASVHGAAGHTVGAPARWDGRRRGDC
jgi:hypothetical protein